MHHYLNLHYGLSFDETRERKVRQVGTFLMDDLMLGPKLTNAMLKLLVTFIMGRGRSVPRFFSSFSLINNLAPASGP